MKNYEVKTRKSLYIGDKQITDFAYDDVIEMKDCIVMVNNSADKHFITLISTSRAQIIKNINCVAEYKCSNNVLCVKYSKNDLWYVFLEDGNPLSIEKFDDVIPTPAGIIVQNGNKMGVYSKQRKLVIPISYDSIIYVNGMFEVTNESLIGLYSKEGKCIVPIKYEHIEEIENNAIIVKKGCLYGLYTTNGKQILNTMYEDYAFTTGKNEFKTGYVLMSSASGVTVYNTNTCKLASLAEIKV